MANEKIQKLLQARDELSNSFISDKEKLEALAKIRLKKEAKFHNYSYGNLVLAIHDFYIRFGRVPEKIAPYKTWQKINRHVKKGEHGMQILVPQLRYYAECPKCNNTTYGFRRIQKGCKCGYLFDNDEINRYTKFGIGYVFDVSQTDGEPLSKELVKNNTNYKFNNIRLNCPLPIRYYAKHITKGCVERDGTIWISIHSSEAGKISTMFHELGHYYLNHYEKLDNKEITRSQAEAEAETVAFMILTAMGFDNDLKSADYINAWHNNPIEVINGEELIQTAEKIMKELKIE